jgi:hypothetical protein
MTGRRGEVNEVHPTDKVHRTMRQLAMPCSMNAPQRNVQGKWEREEDDGDSARTPLS